MAKLYPPVIEGTIPAFYGTTLVVPFSMNRAVAKSDIKGFSLKIKTVQTNTFVKNLTSNDYTTSEVKFNVEDVDLVAGQYYKLQLAYIYNDSYSTIGYYSTVGVVKYYGEEGPRIYVDGLSSKNSNMYTGSYLGVFEHEEDPMEKVAQYRFIITESGGDPVADTGWLVHNTINDINSLSSNDSFKYDDDLDDEKVYYLYYKVITSNNMECSTPGYRILQKNSVGLPLDLGLKAENHFDNGYIAIQATSGDSQTMLTGAFEISRQNVKNPKHWEPIFLFVLQGELPGASVWRDFTVEQGETYRYCVRQFNASGMYSARVYSNEVYADFEDAFLFDGERQLRIRYNPKVSSFKNDILESKTDTIGSKYPFIFRNGHVNYKEFPISGLVSYWSDDEELFLKLEDIGIDDVTNLSRAMTVLNNISIAHAKYVYNYDSDIIEIRGTEQITTKSDKDKKDALLEAYEKNRKYAVENFLSKNYKTTDLTNYNIAAERKFKLEVLEWLTNGKPKLFRSPGEGNYIVRLLNTSLTPTDSVGRMLHTFNCTAYEISEISYNTLAGFGFIKSSLSDEDTQKVYYRSVPLGWGTSNAETYVHTEDLNPKPHKNYYYYNENNEYEIFNTDDYIIDEDYLEDFERYKNENNLYELNYMPVITGKNKQYPVDEDGYIELLTNPYNKDEVINALTIRFDDMSSTDIIYVNGERRMIGGTGVYNLDNGDTIHSVKVRSVANFYKDDYEEAYANYLNQVESYKNEIEAVQSGEDTEEGHQNGIDDYTIILEDIEAEISDCINNFNPDLSPELVSNYNTTREAINENTRTRDGKQSEVAKKKIDLAADEEQLDYLNHEVINIPDYIAELKVEANEKARKAYKDKSNIPFEDTHNMNINSADKIEGYFENWYPDYNSPDPDEVAAYEALVTAIPDNETVQYKIDGKQNDIHEKELAYENLDKELLEALDGRKKFVDQVQSLYDDVLRTREIQEELHSRDNFLKDLNIDKKFNKSLGLINWGYKHTFESNYGHFLVECRLDKNSSYDTPKDVLSKWKSKIIQAARSTEKTAIDFLESKIQKIKKELKDKSIPETREKCNEAIEDYTTKLDTEIEEIEKLRTKLETETDESEREKIQKDLNDHTKKATDYQKEIDKYKGYLSSERYKPKYDEIDNYLELEEDIEADRQSLQDIEDEIKSKFSRIKKTKDELAFEWKYFLADPSTVSAADAKKYNNIGKNYTSLIKKPDVIKVYGDVTVNAFDLTAKTEIKNYNEANAENWIRESAKNVSAEEFSSGKETGEKYYYYNDLIPAWDEYTGTEWITGLRTKTDYLHYLYFMYQDVQTLRAGIELQQNTLNENNYATLDAIRDGYEEEIPLLKVDIMILEREQRSIRDEIKKIIAKIQDLQTNYHDNMTDEELQAARERLTASINTLKTEIQTLEAEIQTLNILLTQLRADLDAYAAAIEQKMEADRDAKLADLRQQKLEAENAIAELTLRLKELKNQLTNYIRDQEPDKRSYLYGDTWENEILNDYDGLFTYSYIDEYSNTFDMITGQSLVDVPCYQINSYDSAENVVNKLIDVRTELMNILQIHGELKQVENIYLLEENDEDIIPLWEQGEPIPPASIKGHFSLDKNNLLDESDLELIENPTYIYQIFPVINHESSFKHSQESGILFGFVRDEEENPYSSGSSKYSNFIPLKVARNDEQAEWHVPSFLFLANGDPNKYYKIDLFNDSEYSKFQAMDILYFRNDNDLITKANGMYDEDLQKEGRYYTRGKKYIHVTYHKNELYYDDVCFYEVKQGEDGKYYLDMRNPYYNFIDETKDGYFLIYDPDVNAFRITQGYSSKIYINTGVTDAQLRWEDGALCDENGEVIQPYLDLAITQEFKTELIPQITDIYVGNGVVLNLSYHARQIDYAAEADNATLIRLKAEWEQAIDDYLSLFYTKVDIDKYTFNEQTLNWENIFRSSKEEIQQAINEAEEKRQIAKDKYKEYLKELQKALDAREAQHSWEKYQEVNSNE